MLKIGKKRHWCKHVMPKKAMADITETVPDTGSDEIVAGDEEVPL